MSRMNQATITTGVTGLFVVLLALVPSLLPDATNAALAGSLFVVLGVIVKSAWTVGLVYVGVRLALRAERQPSR